MDFKIAVLAGDGIGPEISVGVGAGEEGAVGEFLIFIRIGGWFRNHEMDGKLFADSDKMVK